MTYKSEKLNLQSQSIAGTRQWSYSDTGYVLAPAAGVGYFADAKAKGVKIGDVIHCSSSATGQADRFVFLEVQDTGATSGSVGDTG
jgi:hypothetical protein